MLSVTLDDKSFHDELIKLSAENQFTVSVLTALNSKYLRSEPVDDLNSTRT